VWLSRKTSRTLHLSTLPKKLVQRRFSTVELGKGNSEKCAWRCRVSVTWLGRWTCNQQVAGSTPGLRIVE